MGIGGAPANGQSYNPTVDSSGTKVVFESVASNLVPGDTNGTSDVFLRDVTAGTTTRINLLADGGQASGASGGAIISGDGRFVIYLTDQPAVVPDVNGAVPDVILYNVATGTRTLGMPRQNYNSGEFGSLRMSSDGRFIGWNVRAPNYVAGVGSSEYRGYLYDQQTGTLRLGTVNSVGSGNFGGSVGDNTGFTFLSGNGRYGTTATHAYLFSPQQGDQCSHGYIYDLFATPNPSVFRLTPDNANSYLTCTGQGASSSELVVSDTAADLAFSTINSLPGTTPFLPFKSIYRRTTIQPGPGLNSTRINVTLDGGYPTGESWVTGISTDGDLLSFLSESPALTVDDANGTTRDCFVHQRGVGLSRISGPGAARCAEVSLARSGNFAVMSIEDQVTPTDTNGFTDIFLRSLRAPLAPPASSPALGATTFSPKTIRFTWAAVPMATHYILYESASTGAPFRQISFNLTSQTWDLPIAVHKTNWLEGRYQLRACNHHGCSVPSNTVALTQADSLPATGVLNVSTPMGAEQLGQAVAISGDGQTAAIGAPERNSGTGAVYIALASGGTWGQLQRIDGPSINSKFGTSVTLSADGRTLLVGAPGIVSSPGGVAVYTRSGASFQFLQTLTNALNGDQYGRAVSISGDGLTMAVGATTDSVSPGSGSVRLLSRANQTAAFGSMIRVGAPPACASNSCQNFGVSIALSRDGARFIVGSVQGAAFPGAAHVYERSGANYVEVANLDSSTVQIDGRFGSAVAISSNGQTVAVGAYQNDGEAGVAFAFSQNPTNGLWVRSRVARANPPALERCGYSVALSGDGQTMAVGCIREGSSSRGVDSIANNAFPPSVNNFGSTGAVFTYVLNGSNWVQQKYVKGTNPTPGLDQFGWAVSLSQTGDTLLVGAKDASTTVVNAGLAFLF